MIAVRAEVIQPCSRFYSGAGIYRNVWLVTTPSLRFEQSGISVTAELNGDTATITVKTTIVCDVPPHGGFAVDSDVLNSDGKSVAHFYEKQPPLAPGTPRIVNQIFKVDHPMLWSIEKPVLYSVRSTTLGVTDPCEIPFGIRTIEFTKDDGLHLNGKRVQIQGVCDHHDLGCLGAAINPRAIQRQLEILKSFGCNAIRTSHYPPRAGAARSLRSDGFPGHG